MANLKSIEKLKLEKLFEMGSGYIMDFSNRTFQEFILENTGLDIYDSKYDYNSGSKANRLRCLWQKESNRVVGELISNLLEYWKAYRITSGNTISPAEQILYDEGLKTAEKLRNDNSVENIDVIQPNAQDKDFELLARSIRESIAKNEPEAALDRLHTFVIRYMRALCDKYSISYDKETPTHSLMSAFTKYLNDNNIIESEMTNRILKSSISVLDAFNEVRNNRSFAHGNKILNYNESILIFNNVSNVIRFVETIEAEQGSKKKKQEEVDWNDIPF